ncbi:hypothetical protein PQR75_09035 [Paraburkholderia fungorum]|uniref:hypothetical protein n=2 Tax=Paraburkholderia fungorum TaxID=134537 RepID=UPI0038BC3C2D
MRQRSIQVQTITEGELSPSVKAFRDPLSGEIGGAKSADAAAPKAARGRGETHWKANLPAGA